MKRLKYFIKETIKFFIIVTLLANIVSYYKSLSLNKNTLQLSQVKLLNNSTFTLNKKQPILIHFWSTWCPICKIEASNIQKIAKDYQVITIAVDSGDDEKIKTYLKQNNLQFNVISDYDSTIAKKFNISVYPTTLIYDRNKNLVFSEVGYTSTFGLYLRMIWASF